MPQPPDLPREPDLPPATRPLRRPLVQTSLGEAISPLRITHPAVIEAFERLEALAGGRVELAAKLLLICETPVETKLISLLLDPASDRRALADLIAGSEVSFAQLLRLYQRAVNEAAQTLALVEVARKLPEVAASTMAEAISGKRMCPTCDGAGTITPDPSADTPNPAPVTCPTCGGAAIIHHEATPAQQKLALELGKMIKPPSGPKTNISISQQTAVVGGGNYEKLVAASDRAVYGDPVRTERPPPPPRRPK